ncbi:uncharacterized protein LOC134528828 [Bacillus rossius redtenbacheri]|uniref:uncharacterized protein LOC134528828 n=1 Tax=Bacillus rossius redtenbacheri TaxID=93214 RepID=UPI002FDE7553
MFVCTQASTSTSAPQSAIQEVDDEERPAIVGPSQPSTSTSTPLQEQCSCRKRLNFTVNSSWDIPNESRNESYDETKQYDTEYGNEELENLEDWYWEEEVEWCNERVKEEVEKMDEDGDEKCEEKDIEDNGQKASDDNNGGGHDVQVHDMWEEDSSTEGETFRASNKPDGTHPSKKRKLDYSENECLESLTKKLKKM